MKLKPLYIWAGGKTKLINNGYKPFLPTTKPTLYIEPFFGAGALYCWMYNTFGIIPSIINDINKDIMNIYSSIKCDVGQFIEYMDVLEEQYIKLSKVERKAHFYQWRLKNAYEYDEWSITKQSAVLYFLMRTCFNGIFQVNKNTNGRFGTPFGLGNQTNKIYDKQNVLEWNKALKQTEIFSQDYKVLKYPEKSFVFFDPPYRGSFTSYGQDFDDNEQKRVLSLFSILKTQNCNVMLSNRDLGDGFYDEYKPNFIPVTYTAGRRKKTLNGFEAKKAVEILITS